MKRLLIAAITSGCLVASCANVTYRHSGGTDSDGCHENRSTGNYHCHNSVGSTSPGGGGGGGGNTAGVILGVSLVVVAVGAGITAIVLSNNNNQGGPSEGDATKEAGEQCWGDLDCKPGLECTNGTCRQSSDSESTEPTSAPPASSGSREGEGSYCCVKCDDGKPCGDSCIDRDDECHTTGGCACY